VAPPVQLVQQGPARDEGGRNGGVRRAGIALLIAGAALAITGAVFEATSWSKYNSSRNGACLATSAGCAKAADAIEQRALLSKLFFAGGAAAGLTGGALLVFFPITEPGHAATVSGLGARAALAF
jgi:hypothetical protein